jgi:TonB family protein
MTTFPRRRNAAGVRLLATVLIAVTCVFPASKALRAQESEESHRKVVSRIAPEYPNLARSMNLRGVVRVEAVVGSNGVVKKAEVKGGHPVLVQSALTAVYKWRWEPGVKDTHELVLIQFSSR